MKREFAPSTLSPRAGRGTGAKRQGEGRHSAFIVIAVILLAACASGPPPPPPHFTEVPASVLDVMCARLHEEGISAETPVDLVRTSRPLVTRTSLQALAEATGSGERIDQRLVAEAYATNATPLAFSLAKASCSWNPVDANAPRSRDTMTLEFSAPFVAPFGKGSPGILARLALAGESATWYWIPLANRDGTWIPGRSLALAAHE